MVSSVVLHTSGMVRVPPLPLTLTDAGETLASAGKTAPSPLSDKPARTGSSLSLQEANMMAQKANIIKWDKSLTAFITFYALFVFLIAKWIIYNLTMQGEPKVGIVVVDKLQARGVLDVVGGNREGALLVVAHHR